ncbi:hypothetical protein BCR39DRAFT_64727 [Naematelia encephala]|uniref:Uncharacterized protein n=1 Tax=Naematelia encephala TaxID=71784 RepID=A0A1Y2AFP1_9TREE|nr:hypothetical protein BCR39DRAFT_64727 [Naematelia encephala]
MSRVKSSVVPVDHLFVTPHPRLCGTGTGSVPPSSALTAGDIIPMCSRLSRIFVSGTPKQATKTLIIQVPVSLY